MKPVEIDVSNIRLPPTAMAIRVGKQGVVIDKEDWDKIKDLDWEPDSKGPPKTRIVGHKVPLHRFLMNPKTNDDVIFADKKHTNCQKNNLRIVHRHSRAVNPDRRYRYTGIEQIHRGKWRAKCGDYVIGYFNTDTEAAKAYDKYVLDKLGPTAQLNFP